MLGKSLQNNQRIYRLNTQIIIIIKGVCEKIAYAFVFYLEYFSIPVRYKNLEIKADTANKTTEPAARINFV